MSADSIPQPPTTNPGDSKSARKKKAKAEAAVPTLENTSSEVGSGLPDAGKLNGADGGENAYVKELQKNIRGINKKLNATQKTDAIIEANPNVSLDELVATRKLNTDQKAQALKKPGLQAQLAQLEEQYVQYKKFDEEYQQKIQQEKEILQKSHSDEIAKLRSTIQEEAAIESKKASREKILTLSRFLRAAAARRQLEDDESDLTKAFEGALLQVYGGDAIAVAAAEKLIDGTADSVPSTEGVILSITYAQLKQAALEEAPFAAEEAWVDDVAQAQPAPPEYESTTGNSTDPTIANAGLTEIDAPTTVINDGQGADTANAPPAASAIDSGAANAAAAEQWDKQPSSADDPLAESFEIVPRDPTETENAAAPAPISSVESWADDTPEPSATTGSAPANGNDGFSEVHHHHHRGRGRGNFQGDNRGSYRGRGGPRGEGRGRGGRGRGRGDFRGGPRGGFRGGRGQSEAQ